MPTKKPTEPVADELEKKRHEFQENAAKGKAMIKAKTHPRRRLVIGIASLLVLLFGLSAAAVYSLLYQSPDRVVSDAIIRALGSSTTTFKSTLRVGKTLSVDLNGGIAGSQGGNLSLKLDTMVNNKEQALAADMTMDKNGDVYASGEGIKSLLGSNLIADASTPGSYANILQQKVEGKWLKISSLELQPYNRKLASIQSCFETVLRKVQDDQPLLHDAVDIYQKNTFMSVVKTLGTNDGSTGYSVRIDKDKLKAFLQAFKYTNLYRQFNDCDSATFTLDVDKFLARFDGNNGIKLSSVDLWINGQHDITSITVDGGEGDLNGTLAIQPTFNQQVKVIAPTSTISLKELHDFVTEGNQASVLSKLTDPASQQQYQALIDKLKASSP